MIISIDPPFIFSHISKTGGRSVSEALGKYNILKCAKKHITLNDWRQGSYLHTDPFFTFCFVRNPWDRIVSSWAGHFQSEGPFADFVRRVTTGHESTASRAISKRQIRWAKHCDFVGRFELLERDFKTVIERLNIKATLPHIGKSQHPHYSRMYNAVTRQMVAKYYAEDIEHFNYRFIQHDL